jgi:hypothetical protein
MSDLTEILKMQWEAYPNAQKTMNEGIASDIALQNARRAQQERMDLKALYAQQPNPSFQAVGAIDPAFAIVQQQAQMQLNKDQIENKYKETQTGEIEAKRKEEIEKLRIGEAVAVVNQYDQDIESGMPEPQALAKYNDASGQALSMLKQGGMIPPDFPAFDPKVMNPEAVRLAGEGRGFYTEKVKRRQEYEKNLQGALGTYAAGFPPQKSVKNEITREWETPPSPPTQGLTNATPTRELQVAPGAVDPIKGYARVANDPSFPEELRAFAAEKAQTLMPKINAPKLPMTAEQERNLMVKQAAEKEGAITTAKQQAEDAAAWKQTFSAFKDMPPITTQYDEKGAKISEGIDDVINKSFDSQLDVMKAQLMSKIGQHTDASVAEAKLKTIFAGLLSTVKTMPGSQSNVELQQRQAQVGAILDDPTASRESKREAFHAYLDAVQRQIINRLPYSENEIDDLVVKGIMSETAAAKYDKALAAHTKGMR